MTSRLRHKLEIDPSIGGGGNLNESFVLIGTPLPALGDTKRDKGEFVPIWKQEVRDEQGRKRLHGAFQGGFSAGYFNTVGSKEGWAPSTFVSSKNARSSKQQRAEDFMDDEDIEQMKEGRQLENKEGFRNEGFAGTREELKARGPEDSFTSTLSSMIEPSRASVGHTLLQKLGWRPGQGIGPRVSARKRKLQAQKLGLPLNDEDELDEEQIGKHTFAPRDVKLLVYETNGDSTGLGFVKGMREALPGIDDGPSFEDDPYAANAAASTSAEGSRFAFDGEDDDGDVIMMGAAAKKSALGVKGKMRAAPAPATGPIDKWHDGRSIPPGFVLDPKPVVSDKWFAMPDVPSGWAPKPSHVWEKGKRWDQQPGPSTAGQAVPGGRKQLSAEQRGAALGEEARKKSVFDYMSQKDKERLEAFAAAVKAGEVPQPGAPPPSRSEALAPQPPPVPTSIEVPPLSPRTASAALKGFIPFGDDVDKQDRYKSYLSSQCLNTTTPNPALLPNKPLNEQQRELNEFQKSGQMFKPMSFAMSNRFTSASATLALSDSKVSQSGLYVPDPNAVAAEADEVTKMEIELTPRQRAAKNNMYGTMTRTVNDFYPVKLLCKRYGVADPHPGGVKAKHGAGGESGLGLPTELGAPLKTDISWTDKFIHVPGAEAVTNPDPEAETSAPVSSKPKSIGEVGMAEDENQGKDTLTYTKPSIDIFKAIFASDDEGESDDEDDEVPFVVPSRLAQNKHTAADADEAADKPVDLASFKPVFQSRGAEKEEKKGKDKDKKKKKDKKRKGMLTFDMDEGEGGDEVDEAAEKERKEKKRQKREEEAKAKAAAEDGEDEWVEKPAAASVALPTTQERRSAADYM